MIKDKCPLCKSSKLYFIDPMESRARIKKILDTTSIDNLPSDMQNLLGMLNLDKEVSKEEKIFYQLHGRKVLCECCGMTYYEKDDYSKYEEMNATPVSYEEYCEYLKMHVDDEEFINFIINKSKVLEKYYIEALDELIKEYEAVSELAQPEKKETLVN